MSRKLFGLGDEWKNKKEGGIVLVGKGGAIAFERCVTRHDIKCDESSAFAHGVLGKYGSMGSWERFPTLFAPSGRWHW